MAIAAILAGVCALGFAEAPSRSFALSTPLLVLSTGALTRLTGDRWAQAAQGLLLSVPVIVLRNGQTFLAEDALQWAADHQILPMVINYLGDGERTAAGLFAAAALAIGVLNGPRSAGAVGGLVGLALAAIHTWAASRHPLPLPGSFRLNAILWLAGPPAGAILGVSGALIGAALVHKKHDLRTTFTPGILVIGLLLGSQLIPQPRLGVLLAAAKLAYSEGDLPTGAPWWPMRGEALVEPGLATEARLRRLGVPGTEIPPWPCREYPIFGWARGLRQGAVVALPPNAKSNQLHEMAELFRRYSVDRLGILGYAPGAGHPLLAHPVAQLLLDRPPDGAYQLDLTPKGLSGVPSPPASICALGVDESVSIQTLFDALNGPLRQSCTVVALRPRQPIGAEQPCPNPYMDANTPEAEEAAPLDGSPQLSAPDTFQMH